MSRLLKQIFITSATMLVLNAANVIASETIVTSTQSTQPTPLPVVSTFDIKLSAFARFQAGYRNQSKLQNEEKNVSKNKKNMALYSDAAFFVDASKTVEEMIYGGKIVLVPTAKRKSSPGYNGSHIYFQYNYGRVELGSPMLPVATMMIDASFIAAGPVDWDRYVNLETADQKQISELEPSYATYSDFFLDDKLATNIKHRNYSNEPARSVVYYTPKVDFSPTTRVQLGISYTPDSSNTGADNHNANSSGEQDKIINNNGVNRFVIDRSVKDAVSGGISLEQDLSDGIDLKISVIGERGTAVGQAKRFINKDDTKPDAVFKLSNLRTMNVGAVLNVGNFSYAGSFGTLGKSLTSAEFHKTGRKTNYYTAAVAYKQGPFGVSISYFKSEQFKNKVDAVSLGGKYMLAAGLEPYAEVSHFILKGRPEFYPQLSPKKTRGTVALIGAKLSI